MISQTLLSAALLATAAQAVDVAFTGDNTCTANVLFGRISIPNVPCYSLAEHPEFSSVALSHFDTNQVVRFFSDNSCEKEIHGATEQECFSPSAAVGSFLVEDNSQSLAEHAASTDIALRLSNYAGTNVTDPFNIDLSASVATLAGVGLLFAAGAYTFSSAVRKCVSYVTGDTAALEDCIGPIISTVVSWVGGYLLHKGAPKVGQSVQNHLSGATRQFNSDAKRSVPPAFEWFEDLQTRDVNDFPTNFTHAGYLEREFENVTQRSAIMEVRDESNMAWHFSAFVDPESGDVFYHVNTPEGTELARREQIEKRSAPYSYNSLTFSGGLDFATCGYNADQPATGFAAGTSSLYTTAYDQIHCQYSGSSLASKTGFLVDMYNTNSVLKGAVSIRPYTGSYSSVSIKCSSNTANVNQACVIA